MLNTNLVSESEEFLEKFLEAFARKWSSSTSFEELLEILKILYKFEGIYLRHPEKFDEAVRK